MSNSPTTKSSVEFHELVDEALKLDASSAAYTFPEFVGCVKFNVEWRARSKMQCELKLQVHCYDERARFIEKLYGDLNIVTKDGSCQLLSANHASLGPQDVYVDKARVEFDKVDHKTSAIAIFLDGEPRIYQYVESITVECCHVPTDGNEVSFLLSSASTNVLFKTFIRPHKEYQGICLCVLYKDRWMENHTAIWATKVTNEPVYLQTSREKDDKCLQISINSVPALERYRPRIFENIRDMCAALSSRSLPKLKKSFMRSESGLNLDQFTTVLFNQLFETHPRVADVTERGYVVALIHEMFSQIDYNNDNSNDWDEFTTFCVQIGVGGTGLKQASSTDGRNLDEYIIEYGEDSLLRDHVLSQQRGVNVLRYIPQTQKLMLIQDEGEGVMLLNEDFHLTATFEPFKLVRQGALETKKGPKRAENIAASAGAYKKILVYDCVYLSGRGDNLFATSSSDHAITIIRESTTMLSTGKGKSNFVLLNKVYHNMLHTKLCWIATTGILCSVGSDHQIYGWNTESRHPIFQVNRHEDIITDFIAVESMEVFVTCSMDKRIVMWSAKSRRVKGIMLGHERGVRSLSNHQHILLSSGFETDALTWDLNTREQIGVLRGHRATIVAAKLMCELARTEKEYRAVTVDESGEFRLWDIFISERSSEPVPAVTLQIFEMHNNDPPLNKFKFLVIPNNLRRSTGNYSDIIACSTKLLHFLPEKNAKEFVAPTCSAFNESAAAVMTAVGRSLTKYDLNLGKFTNVYPDIHTSDITAMCLDRDKRRYLFIGSQSGHLLLVNFLTGLIVDKIEAHNREISCVTAFKTTQNKVCVGFIDGKVKMIEEIKGKLSVHNAVDDIFGANIGIQEIKVATDLRCFVASSVGNTWGVWSDTTFRRIMLVKEKSNISAIEIIQTTLKKGSDELRKEGTATTENKPKEHLLTIAVAVFHCIRVYTLDLLSFRGIISFELLTRDQMYINQIVLLDAPLRGGVNYSISQDIEVGKQLVVATDSGQILSWNANHLGEESEKKFYKKYAHEFHREMEMRKAGGLHLTALSRTMGRLKTWATDAQEHVQHKHALEDEAAASAAEEDDEEHPHGSKIHGGIDSSIFLTDSSVVDEAIAEHHRHVQAQMHGHHGSRALHRRTQTARRPSIEGQFGAVKRPNTSGGQRERRSSINSIEGDGFGDHSHSHGHGHGQDNAHRPATAHHGNRRSSLDHNGHHLLSASRRNSTEHGPMPHVGEQPKVLFSEAVDHKLPQRDRSKSPSAGKDGRSASVFMSSPSLGLLRRTIADRCWGAHLDSIVALEPLHEHGCVLTVSLDGYHRVWNMNEDCLGELALPNITEKMKNPEIKLNLSDHWMFILEKLKVLPIHRQIADELTNRLLSRNSAARIPARVSMAQAGKLLAANFPQLRPGTGASTPLGLESTKVLSDPTESTKSILTRDGRMSRMDMTSPSNFDSPFQTDSPIQQQQVVASTVRNAALRAMNAPAVLPDDAPPMRVLTREEHRLEEKNKSMLASLGILPGNEDEIIPGTPKKSQQPPSSGRLPSPALGKKAASVHFEESTDNRSGLFPGHMLNSMSTTSAESLSRPSSSTTRAPQPLWSTSEEFCNRLMGDVNGCPASFSEASLMYSRHDGYINGSEFRLLKKIASQPDKVSAYDRTEPVIFLRNPAMASTFEIPDVESADKSEITFGSQKAFYRNASKYIIDKDRQNKQSLLNSLSMARIGRDVSKVPSMIHVLNVRTHDEIVIPKEGEEDDNDKLRSDEQKMQIRLMQSAALVPRDRIPRPLDREGISSRLEKFKEITEHVDKSKEKKIFRKKVPITQTMKVKLLAKFELTIKEAYKHRRQRLLPSAAKEEAVREREREIREHMSKDASKEDADGTAGNEEPVPSRRGSISNSIAGQHKDAAKSPSRIKLTTRQLLPYYTLDDVVNFMETFSKVDEDFSGDLDIGEWVHLFGSINVHMAEHDARMIFMKLDKNGDGYITMRELIPVIFSRASRQQLKLIIDFASFELIKKQDGIVTMSLTEMEQLFEYFDVNNLGYVSVSAIREQVNRMQLPEPALFMFFDCISVAADDEMVNLSEFVRLLKLYVEKSV